MDDVLVCVLSEGFSSKVYIAQIQIVDARKVWTFLREGRPITPVSYSVKASLCTLRSN